ncbi:MAG TPA: hypothetical protein VMV10_11920 [Pirellulales bacterium]|nr:hypothetical protein [Pirellulales bacterium]
MTIQAKLRLACGVLAAWGALTAAAQAQSPNLLYFFGLNGLPYSNGNEHVPYYSLYPPVYYSMPVPRTYGHSPFAYPPGYMTPEVEMLPAPKTIVNPHAAPSANSGKPKKAVPPAGRTTQAPRTILNPFVEQRGPGEPELLARTREKLAAEASDR